MRYKIDHDLHIHTCLSNCSGDPNQTPKNILQYATENGLKTICVTDHYWDSEIPLNLRDNAWYENQNFNHIVNSLPLPQGKNVRFLFGCEVEMGSNNEIAMTKRRYDDFDFIIVSTTHFHLMCGENWDNANESKLVDNWIKRFEAVLNSDLPFEKVGLAHLATPHIYRKDRETYLKVLDLIPTSEMVNLFTKSAKLGIGLELNSSMLNFKEQEKDSVLRMFKVAKACNCKFYLGSDAHKINNFKNVKSVFERAIDLLELKESDKFILKA